MPTGYTAFIEDGTITTGKDFLMLCARNFGATIEMMDEPLSTPIPKEFKPDNMYEKWLEEDLKELAELRRATEKEIQKAIDEHHEKAVKENREHQERQRELKHKYMDILEAVKAWEPPTEGHIGLKNFAIEQIEVCIPDTSKKIYSEEKPSVTEWLEINLAYCLQSIERHKKMAKEEAEKCDKMNKWLKELRESLGIGEE